MTNGACKIDIASRITKFVKLAKEGVWLENAAILVGQNRRTLQVHKEKQRVSGRGWQLEVEYGSALGFGAGNGGM